MVKVVQTFELDEDHGPTEDLYPRQRFGSPKIQASLKSLKSKMKAENNKSTQIHELRKTSPIRKPKIPRNVGSITNNV